MVSSACTNDDEDDLQKSNQLFDAISLLRGKIINEWASLDSEVIMLASDISQCPSFNMGVIYFALNNFASRLSVVKGLISHCLSERNDEKLEGLDIIEKLRELAKRRNNFVHAEYAIAKEASQKRFQVLKFVFRSERKELIARSPGQTGELEDHIRRVSDMKFIIEAYRSKIKDKPL